MKKNLIFIFAVLLLAGCSLQPVAKPNQLPNNTKQFCTQEAKLCPDGSAVGRTGPNCEFSLCPGENQLQIITNFEECAAAGNPIMESYPRQCRANGQTFVEELSDADKAKLQPPTEPACKDLCGDGVCQEIVCLAIGCPCSETPESCPQDCAQKINQ